MIRTIVLTLSAMLAIPALLGDAPTSVGIQPVASPEPGWPQWRGPRRDGVSLERGLLQTWPASGPPRVWAASGIGSGYSSPIVAGGRIFITGDVGADLRITALDPAGKQIWQSTNGRAWRGQFPGARGACAYARGNLYHMNAHGRTICIDAANGKERWAVDMLERFGGRNIEWGLSECLLVDWPRLIVTAGGSKASVAALDTRTGATVWASPPIVLAEEEHKGPDAPSYSSPILVTAGGRRLVIGCTGRTIYMVDAGNGNIVWTRPLPTRYGVIAMTPAVVGSGFFVGAPDTDAGAFFTVSADGGRIRVAEAWRTKLDPCQGGVLAANGRLYAARYRRSGWVSLDPADGSLRDEAQDLAMGSAIWADGRLICVAQNGEIALVRPTPSGFAFEGRFRVLSEPKNDIWAHPVLVNGRLYIRAVDTLHCFDVRRR